MTDNLMRYLLLAESKATAPALLRKAGESAEWSGAQAHTSKASSGLRWRIRHRCSARV
jgi:hypothetical protein